MTVSEQIDFFFTPPLPMQTGSSLSLLHLNRREIQDCLIGDVIPEGHVASDPRAHRLFATVMVIAAGIDLLSKFYAGSDKIGEVKTRVVAFAKDFMFDNMASPEAYAEVFYYGCRNPMLHSFSVQNDRYRMSLVNELASAAIWKAKTTNGAVTYVISVRGLYAAFITAIGRYEATLRADAALQTKFAVMFPTYGAIGVWSAAVEAAKQ